MHYTVDQLQARFKQLGYQWPKFHLIGVRSKADAPNQFDDVFYLIVDRVAFRSTGTTNPGSHWLKNVMTKLGAAVMAPGQYLNCYKLGLHRGSYEAWVQASPVAVFRDNDRDVKSEAVGQKYWGFFGINIHRASASWISKLIDKWSAGCQVFNNPAAYKQFIELSKKSGQVLFTYTLLDEF